MEQITIFDEGRKNLIEFFNSNYEGFDSLLLSHFLSNFNDLLDYREEGTHTKPKIIFTNNIDGIIKAVPKAYKLQIFMDDDASMFRSRLKPLIAISKKEWCIYIENKDEKFIYGICKTFNSLKEKSLLTEISESEILREKADKIHCIVSKSINDFEMDLFSTTGNKIRVNTALSPIKEVNNEQTIRDFTEACFSNLRTTKKKLSEVQIMFGNIFTKVVEDLNGAICVVVDKSYKDNGFFEDGIWLDSPISFSKLFTQSKSYSEEKLQAFASLFINMLNFDGITVVDTAGQVLAYNVFVESNIKRAKNVIGGARKRAAYTIINSRRKHIVGVYFQSHEGEIFYKSLKKPKTEKKIEVKSNQELEVKSVQEVKVEETNQNNQQDVIKEASPEKISTATNEKTVENKSEQEEVGIEKQEKIKLTKNVENEDTK